MYRLFVVTLNIVTFLFAQNSWALAPSDVAVYTEFFKQTGLSKQDVPLKEIHQKYGHLLNPEAKKQMDLFLSENPNIKVPKMNVQAIGQELQISIQTEKENLLIRTNSNSKTQWGTVVGTRSGQEVKAEISNFLMFEGDQYIYQARTEEENKKPKFIKAEVYNKLSIEQKSDYVLHIRQLLEAVEATQNAFAVNKEVSIYQLLIEDAWALDGTCVIAGWLSNYGGANKCQLPKSYLKGACQGKTVQCNPLIYGDNACVNNSDLQIATSICNRKTDSTAALKAYVGKKILDEKSFNELHQSLISNLNGFKSECDNISKRSVAGKAGQDQFKTCEQLRLRIQDINKLQCKMIQEKGIGAKTAFKCNPDSAPKAQQAKPVQAPTVRAQKVSGNDENCGVDGAVDSNGNSNCSSTSSTSSSSAATPVVSNAGKSGVDAQPRAETAAPQKPQERSQDNLSSDDKKIREMDCAELRKVQGNLKCGSNAEVKKLSCEFSDNGKTVLQEMNYCFCNDSSEARGNGRISQAYAVECAKNEPTRSSESSRRSKSKESDSSPFLAGLAKAMPFILGFAFMYLIYDARKQQMDNYYKMYQQQMQTINPPVPPPTTSTTVIPVISAPPAGGTR